MNKAKWPEIDMDLAVNCIESRRKLKGKVQEWCDEPKLIFPRRLSAEQCSSSATGEFKAEVAVKISRLASLARNDNEKRRSASACWDRCPIKPGMTGINSSDWLSDHYLNKFPE